MKRRIIQNSILIALVAIMFCCTLLTPETAYAWQTKTHGYSANLLLQEIEDGYITVDGVDYEVPEEYAIALRKFPEAFRAGSLGPDYYPDIVSGQFYIHPYNEDEGISVGDWLMLLVDAVNSMPKDRVERMEALAFTLGMAVHYAGDQFGHDFINSFAGSTYPSIPQAALEAAGGDLTKLLYIFRHMWEEKYMDQQIGDRLGNTEVDAPDNLLLYTWVFNGPANNGAMAYADKYSKGIVVWRYLIDFRNALHNFAETYRDSVIRIPIKLSRNPLVNIAAESVAGYALTAKIVDRVDAWVEDIDNAIAGLIIKFDESAHDILADDSEGKNHKGAINIVKQRVLDEWVDEYAIYMAPWSDWITDTIKWISNELDVVEEWVKDQLGITALQEAWDQFLNDLKDALIPWGLDMIGIDYETCKELYEDKGTELWLQFFLEADSSVWHDLEKFTAYLDKFINKPNELKKELERQESDNKDYSEFMGYMETFEENPEALEPFYNTVLLGKLILMGPDNLNTFFKKYGVTSSFQKAKGHIMVDELMLEIHTAENSSFLGITDNYGTEDNVYIDIYKKGTAKPINTKLLDTSMKDDFANGEWNTFYVELADNVSPDQVSLDLRIEKLFSLKPDLDAWTPDEILITCRYKGITVFPKQRVLSGKQTLSKPGQKLSLSLNVDTEPLTYTSALNPQIISYMMSNDNSTQWVNDKNLLWSNMTARRNILYEVFKGFKPEIKLTADNTTFMQGTKVTLTGDFTSKWNGIEKERRDKEKDLNKTVHETLQQACNGTVKIMDVSSTPKQILSGKVTNGKMTVDLSTLAPGTYKLRADYDGDAFNGSAQSNIVTITVTGTPVATHTVTYKVVDGTWADGSTTDKSETVVNGSSPSNVPTGMIPNTGFTGGSWNSDPTAAIITGDTIFTYIFAPIPVSDYTVTYKVVNGTWPDGSTVDKVENVTDGSSPVNVPTGMIANSGFTSGSWNVNPSAAIITGDTTFTYTFASVPISTYNVTYKVVNGTWADGSTTDKVESVTSGSSPVNVPTGMIASSGFTGGSWNIEPVSATITGNITFTFTFTPAAGSTTYYTYFGSGQNYVKDSGEDKQFSVKRSVDDDKTFSLFTGIQVDGKDVDKSQYNANAGSVIITLKSSYLNTLSVGDHVMTVLFTDGKNDIPFTVTAKAKPIDHSNFNDVAVPSDTFTFKKVWQGDHEDSIDFTLYKADGSVYHHGFDKRVVSKTEWRYNAYFSAPAACYVIEKPVPGYQIKYVNVGVYADVTDRCCDGGTIINKKVPKTGDAADFALWAGIIALGVVSLTTTVILTKRKKAHK